MRKNTKHMHACIHTYYRNTKFEKNNFQAKYQIKNAKNRII